jgi:hypothetical protein
VVSKGIETFKYPSKAIKSPIVDIVLSIITVSMLDQDFKKIELLTVHPVIVYRCDGVPPCLDVSEMLVKETEI